MLVWQRRVGGRRYEVRSAGRTLRLYTDGVLHSQYNPNRIVTGNVWDLLLLPALFSPAGAIRRVLVLGIGGGAVLPMLRRFVAPAQVDAVELDPVHLDVARRFFGAAGPATRLIEGDAVAWLRRRRGAPYDLIIDDLFGEVDGAPQRAVSMDAGWCALLLRHLAPGGTLVANFPDRATLKAAACVAARDRRFPAAFSFTTEQAENRVLALLGTAAGPHDLRQRLMEFPELDPRRARCALRYRLRRLWGG